MATGLLSLIEKERQGESVSRALLKSLLRMFSELGIYEQTFQHLFLQETSRFYMAEGDKYLQEVEVAAYLEHCEVGLCHTAGGALWNIPQTPVGTQSGLCKNFASISVAMLQCTAYLKACLFILCTFVCLPACCCRCCLRCWSFGC